MLCNKISENPRKVFFTIARSGDEQNFKTNIFSNPTSLTLSFAPGHRMFHGKRCIFGHPNVHISAIGSTSNKHASLAGHSAKGGGGDPRQLRNIFLKKQDVLSKDIF